MNLLNFMNRLKIFNLFKANKYRYIILFLSGFNIVTFSAFCQDGKNTEESARSETPIKGEEPFKEVQIDLKGNYFRGTLPFEEPFIIKGEKSANFLKVEAWYLEAKNRSSFSSDSKPGKDNIFGKDGTDKTKCWTFVNRWQNKEGLIVPKKDENDPFSILVEDELKPNSYYRFHFNFQRKLSDTERESVKVLVGKNLKNEIEAMNKNGEGFVFSDSQIDSIMEYTRRNITYLLEPLEVNFGELAKSPYLFSRNLEVSIRDITTILNKKENEKVLFDTMIEDGLKNTYQKPLKQFKLSSFNYEGLENLTHKSLDETFLHKDKLESLVQDINKFNEELKIYRDQNKNKLKANELQLINNFILFLPELINTAVEFSSYGNQAADLLAEKSKNLVEIISNNIFIATVVSGNSIGNFQTRSKYYFSADLGVAILPAINKASPYFGTNLYFAPVNKEKPLKWTRPFSLCREEWWRNFGRRASILIGLTTTSLGKSEERTNLFSTFNLLTGAGIRVADAIRVNGGVVWYEKNNPNPLIQTSIISASPFVSLSFDVDVRTVFNKLFNTDEIENNFIN